MSGTVKPSPFATIVIAARRCRIRFQNKEHVIASVRGLADLLTIRQTSSKSLLLCDLPISVKSKRWWYDFDMRAVAITMTVLGSAAAKYQ
jgi:hypothetical protein